MYFHKNCTGNYDISCGSLTYWVLHEGRKWNVYFNPFKPAFDLVGSLSTYRSAQLFVEMLISDSDFRNQMIEDISSYNEKSPYIDKKHALLVGREVRFI